MNNVIKLKIKTIKDESNAHLIFKGGLGVSPGIASGKLRYMAELSQAIKVEEGEIILAKDIQVGWGSVLKKPAGIIVQHGGPTSHIGVLSMDMGIACIVGIGEEGLLILKEFDGKIVTIDATHDKIFEGKPEFEEKERVIDIGTLKTTKTRTGLTKVGLMFSYPVPEKELSVLNKYSSFGGNLLIRTEFILLLEVGIHPMALIQHYENKIFNAELKEKIDKAISYYGSARNFFIEKMVNGIINNLNVFPDCPNTIRTFDIKSNEYKELIGGSFYEKDESNPMMGFRGAFRFISPEEREISKWQLEVIKKIKEMGYKNLKLIFPMVRDPLELAGGERLREKIKKAGFENWRDFKGIFEIMEEVGLKPHQDIKVGIEIEVPSNVLRAEEFAEILDFGQIGPNDLTQFCLASDRENLNLNKVFNPANPAVITAVKKVIKDFKSKNKEITIIGQNFPEEFLKVLIEEGIDCIGTTGEEYFDLIEKIAEIEENLSGFQGF